MKFNLILPDSRNYKYMGKSANGSKWIWQDQATSLVQIHSTIEQPFCESVAVFVALEQGRTRSDRRINLNKYPKRLLLKVSPRNENLETATLTREVVKAQFAYNKEPVIAFAAFYSDLKNYWVYYKLKLNY